MKSQIKKYAPILSIIVGSILFIVLFSYIGFQSEDVQQTSNDKVTKMQYVLVNEDAGTTFEGKKYNLGTDFVTLINQDDKNRWETTTRDIAKRGVENGTFDAQIILPRDFSERLLSLQTITPEKAFVEYQVREGQNELTNQGIQLKVNDVLKEFNQRIIQMYFSSIVRNLSDAQQNVNQIVGLESDHQSKLDKNIYLPFKEVPTDFASVTDTASILDEENKAFTAQQQAFVASVKSLMETNNKGLEENSQSTEQTKKSVDAYADEANKKLETAINQFNDQFDVQKVQLEKQWGNDLSVYKNQYNQINQSITDQLGLFYTPRSNGSEDLGVYADFLGNATAFKETQGKRIEELENEIHELEAQVKNLTMLKEDVSEKYFNDKKKTPDTLDSNSEDVKEAIRKLISPRNNESELPNSHYLGVIKDQLLALNNTALPSEEDLNKLIAILESKKMLDDDTAQNIRAAYALVIRFDDKHSISPDEGPFLQDKGKRFELVNRLDPANSTFTIRKDFTITSTFTIDLTKLNQMQSWTFGSTDSRVRVDNLQEIQSKLESSVSRLGSYEAHWTVNGDAQMIQLELVLPEGFTGTIEKPTASNVTLPISYSVIWNLDTDYRDPRAFFSDGYEWKKDNNTMDSGPLSVYVDKDEPLKNDLNGLFALFTQLISTAEKITTIYADPAGEDANLSIKNFSAYSSSHENGTKSFAELASENSIYWLYNNLTNDKKNNQFIPDSLVDNYKANGIELYNEVDTQIKNLQKTIGSKEDKNEGESPTLYGTRNLMTTPDKLLDEATKLKTWYDQASETINKTYNSWSEAEKVAAETVITESNPHPEKNQTTSINAETENLVKSIQLLASSSRETAQTTGEAAAKVKDISPDIQKLKESTKKVETNANGILNNLDKTVSDVQATTKDNTEYAKKFDQVLSNTKNGGKDNSAVFNFLSNPIQDKGEFGKTRQTSFIPYYATIVAVFSSLFVAAGLQRYMKRRKEVTNDLLVNPSRPWSNLSNVIIASVSSGLIGTVFALNLSMLVGTNAKFAWFSYAFLVLFASAMLILGCMRQFRTATLYMCGALFGLFFMLTPLLGIAIKPGSLPNILFRISPLQNIQNGFTALLDGGSIGGISYLTLVLLAGIGIFINFWVKPEETEKFSK